MRSFALAVLILGAGPGCKRTTQCCPTPDCSGGSDEQVGTDVLSFRGRVPKNLLFLSIDTLRRDHLGAHGGVDTTPFLDSVASEGVVMNDHHQCSDWTFGGMTCTLAGAYDNDRGHLTRLNGGEKQRPPVPKGTPFLATWLGRAGFRTAGVTSNKHFSADRGNSNGYEKFKNPPGEGKVAGSKGLSLLSKLLKGNDDPWFLHLHLSEPHAPYKAPDKYNIGLDELEPYPENLKNKDTHYDERRQWPDMSQEDQDFLEAHLRLAYAGQVREADAIIEDLWMDYDDKCWLDDTLVVVWNDHGEAFWEHGAQTHAYNLTGEENDGILFFWSKNIVAGVYDGPTSAIDLVPTLLDLYGLEIPKQVTGLPIGTARADRPIFAQTIARNGAVQAVTKLGYKLQYHWNSGALRMWNRAEDPLERDNIFSTSSDVAQDLWSELRPEVERMSELVIGSNPEPVWPEDMP